MNQNYNIEIYIPDIFKDRNIKNNKDIPDSFGNGFYRYYRIVFENSQKIGYIKYHVEFNNPTFEIDRLEIDFKFQNKSYGTKLLSESLKDLIKDFPYLEKVNVYSSPNAINFYKKNNFEPYLGDNNLTKSLIHTK